MVMPTIVAARTLRASRSATTAASSPSAATTSASGSHSHVGATKTGPPGAGSANRPMSKWDSICDTNPRTDWLAGESARPMRSVSVRWRVQ